MYSREIAGRELTFGVSGKLIRNTLVMYDRPTGSLWSQLLGQAVDGELKGTELEYLPSWQTTWADWVERHPNTLALKKGFSGRRDPYQSYYQSGQAGAIGERVDDDRLYVKQAVIGVERNGEAMAFPFTTLNDEPVVNAEVGGRPVLIVFDPDTASGVVFDRRVGERTLTFERLDGLTLEDEQTGTRWNGLTGEALEGAMAGTSLSRVKSTSAFWFGWKDWFPETEVYGLAEGEDR